MSEQIDDEEKDDDLTLPGRIQSQEEADCIIATRKKINSVQIESIEDFLFGDSPSPK